MSISHRSSDPAAATAGGIVLAGGLSQRMGRAKAWLRVGGRTMLETVLASVEAGLPRGPAGARPPLVVVGAPGQELPELPGVVIARDEVDEQGPLQGLAAGLAALEGQVEAAYVSSCDVPLLRPGFVARMRELLGGASIAVPRVDGRFHPLAGIYRLGVLPVVRELLADGKRRPFFLFERVTTRIVEADDLRAIDPDLESLRNINTPDDYRDLLGTLAASPAGRPAAPPPAAGVDRSASTPAARVVFELYGVARMRAGCHEVPVSAGTVGEALAALERACPQLSGALVDRGRLTTHARLSVNGRDFVSEPARPLSEGDRLILISAAAGG